MYRLSLLRGMSRLAPLTLRSWLPMNDTTMQNPSSSLLPFRSKEVANQATRRNSGENFFSLHHVGDIVRSLFLTSLLWVFLAVGVYTVYTMIAGAH